MSGDQYYVKNVEAVDVDGFVMNLMNKLTPLPCGISSQIKVALSMRVNLFSAFCKAFSVQASSPRSNYVQYSA